MAGLGGLVMDFIKGATAAPDYFLNADIINPAKQAIAMATGNQQAYNNAVANQGKTLGATPGQAIERLAGNTAQVGLDAFGGAAAKGIEAPIADAVGGVAGKAVGSAAAGGALGGASGVSSGVAANDNNPKDLAMDFIQDAGIGAATGGLLGGAGAAIKANAKPVYALDNDTAQKLADESDPNKVEKILKPVTGDIVANDVKDSVAQTNDPNIIKNEVQDDLNKKLAPASSQNVPAVPSPDQITPIPQATSVSDINTPQQVSEQGSALTPQSYQNVFGSEYPGDEAIQAQNTPPQPEAATFMNGPDEAPKPTLVNRQATLNDMGNMINSGQFTNDELLAHYMDKTPGANMSDAQNALDETIQKQGIDKSKINASLNPQTNNVKDLAPVAEGDKNGALLNGRNAGQNMGQAAMPAIKAMKALSPEDRELTRYLRGKNPDEVQAVIKSAQYPEAFQNYVNASKNYLDYAQASGAKYRQPLPYRANYGGRTPYDPPEGLPEAGQPRATNPQTPAYTQQRYFNTHEEALANGYTPRNEDPLTDLINDVNQRAYNQTQLALAQGFEQAFPGQVKYLNTDSSVPAGYHQVLVPGGEHIALPADIADPINERVITKTPGSILGMYDSINQAGKELELGGGTFHGFNTMGTFVGQQLLSGKALTDMGATAKVVSNFFSDSHMQSYLDDASDATQAPSGGVDENHSLLDGANASGLNIKNTSVDIKSPGDKGLAGKIASIPGLKQIHDAVFSRQIPTMMLETFRQATQGLDIFGSADDRLAAEKIARGINKEFGVTDHDLSGLTSQQFQRLGRYVLAPGYQEGVLHTLVTALDPRNLGTAEGKLARQAVFGKALLFGGLATLGSIAGGNFKGDTPKQTALAILNKAVNPSFDIGGYKVSTPATFVSDVAKPIEESVASARKGQGIMAGPEDFANSHLAFAPSKITEVAANKNYEGNAIYGKDYYGRPISGATTAENLASGILPIPLAQTSQAAVGNQSTSAAIANTLGFNVQNETANNINYSPIAAQTYLQEVQSTPNLPKGYTQAAEQFVSALGAGDVGRSKTLNKAATLLAEAEKNPSIATKNRAEVQKLIDDYNQQLVKALLPWAESPNAKYADNNMLSLLRSTEITYKNANSNVNYDINTNPTSVGVPVGALQTTNTTGAV